MKFQFGNAECDQAHGFYDYNVQSSKVCDTVNRTWLANTMLNGDLIFGLTLMGFSIWWTAWQLRGYYHKMNVSILVI